MTHSPALAARLRMQRRPTVVAELGAYGVAMLTEWARRRSHGYQFEGSRSFAAQPCMLGFSLAAQGEIRVRRKSRNATSGDGSRGKPRGRTHLMSATPSL